jgi:hypothetical protein
LRNVLIVSPHFPPVNAPDCQRVRMALPYFRRNGWNPTVLAVEARHREDWIDLSLAESLPADVRIVRCGAYDRRFTRLLGINNLGLRAVMHVNRAGSTLLARQRFDLVFFSTTQYLITPLGPSWRRSFGVPYVVDLQDPWRSDYYERPGAPSPPGGWKYNFARFTSWLYEERAMGGAAGLMSVSMRYLRELQERYGWAELPPHAVIPFGAPQADFDHIALRPQTGPDLHALDRGRFNWVATGVVGPQFNHALRVLLAGLARLRAADPALADRIRLHFIGTSYADTERNRPYVLPVAARYGVGDLVIERPARVGYLDSLRLMRQADGLLLLGTDDPAYAPSKLFPYYLADRPILALVHSGSLLESQVRRLRCAHVAALLTPGAEAEATPQVAATLTISARGEASRLAQPRCETWFRANLTAEALAARQCELFDRAVAARSR